MQGLFLHLWRKQAVFKSMWAEKTIKWELKNAKSGAFTHLGENKSQTLPLLPLQWTRQHFHSPTSPPARHPLSLSQLKRKEKKERKGLMTRKAVIYLYFTVCRRNLLISSCLWMRPLLLSLKSTWASLYFVITSTNFLDSTACWEAEYTVIGPVQYPENISLLWY